MKPGPFRRLQKQIIACFIAWLVWLGAGIVIYLITVKQAEARRRQAQRNLEALKHQTINQAANKFLSDYIPMKKSKPEFPTVVKEKPEVVNKNYPLQTIDHRDFEKLIYCLFEKEMQVGRYKDLYDDIWLMEGVREKGKDCSLYKGGKLAGVVQCKHSETLARVGKVTIAKDIIKFLLHIINSEEKIARPFHYYFTVSSSNGGLAFCKKLKKYTVQ